MRQGRAGGKDKQGGSEGDREGESVTEGTNRKGGILPQVWLEAGGGEGPRKIICDEMVLRIICSYWSVAGHPVQPQESPVC